LIWDIYTLNALNKIVYQNYNSRFWNKLDEWESYLENIGVDRKPLGFPRRSSDEERVWIECPHSVNNSIVGSIHSKRNLYFPKSLAEKILVMEQMPP
jgi:hypothetical protein